MGDGLTCTGEETSCLILTENTDLINFLMRPRFSVKSASTYISYVNVFVTGKLDLYVVSE